MIICNHCGTPLSEGLDFCTECGAAAPSQRAPEPASTQGVVAGPDTTVSATPGHLPDYSNIDNTGAASSVSSPANAASTPKVALLVGGAVLIALVSVIAAISFRSASPRDPSPASLALSLQNAIQNGRLVNLANDDAYTYYFQLKSLDPQHKVLNEIRPVVLPQLRTLGDEVFRRRVELSLEILSEQEWTRAQRAYEWAHALEPTNKLIEARWDYATGHVFRLQGRRSEAQTSLTAALQLDPSWAAPQNDLGYLLVLSKRYSEAIPYYQQAIKLQSGWDIPYNNLGTALYYQKNYDAAEAWYRSAIGLNAQWATPHAWLGSIFENRKQNDVAVQEYQTALQLYNANRDRINTVELTNKVSALQQRH